MRKTLMLLAMLLVATDSLQGQRVTRDSLVKRDIFAMIDAHPDLPLRQDMKEWYERGRLSILVDPRLKGLACGLRNDGKPRDERPVLLVSPDFFRDTHLSDDLLKDPNNARMEKFGQLYHEYSHISDHLSGKRRLNFPKNAPLASTSKHFWVAELDGYLAEWRFLKRMGYTHVFVKPEFANLSEWEQFIRTVYHYQKLHPRYQLYKAYWDRFFQEALKQPKF